MQITQHEDHVTLDQYQYSKNITTRIEKTFKNPIKMKDSPLPTGFIPTKDDCPKNHAQMEEVKRRFRNLHYRCQQLDPYCTYHAVQDLTCVIQ